MLSHLKERTSPEIVILLVKLLIVGLFFQSVKRLFKGFHREFKVILLVDTSSSSILIYFLENAINKLIQICNSLNGEST